MSRQARQSPRLKDFDYTGPLAAHLVFVTRRREGLFSNPDLANVCLDSLLRSCRDFSVDLVAYCLMPDHVHVLVVVPEGASMKEFSRRFKQLSGYALKQRIGDFAWQTSYYDHILRKEEALLDVALYIWENPVADGLAETWMDYQFSGPREAMKAAIEAGAPTQT
jgi:REP element-mobilizing transposase RayT